MPRKKKPPLSFVEQMRKIAAARLKPPQGDGADVAGRAEATEGSDSSDSGELEGLELRIRRILGMTDRVKKEEGRMLFFVMYDIEDNKVRGLISKYLIRKGCTRIQRSIFLAETPIETYDAIKSDLAEVQATYENNDSIIILPVTTDYLRMMKVIGQKIEVDVITHTHNTLFF